jgi:hypothetical protein
MNPSGEAPESGGDSIFILPQAKKKKRKGGLGDFFKSHNFNYKPITGTSQVRYIPDA